MSGVSGRRRALFALAAGTAVAAVGTGAVGAGAASAAPVSLTLDYTCDFPYVGHQRVTVALKADVPGTHRVGEPSRPFPVEATATVSGLLTGGLRLLGVHSVAGTADGSVDVTAPQGGFRVGVPFTIPATVLPGSGDLRVPVTGTAPSVTFTAPGRGRIDVGDFTLHLTARDADGRPKLGRLDPPCTVDGGQRTTIESFDVRPRPTPAPTPSASPSAGVPAPPSSGRTSPHGGAGAARKGGTGGHARPTAASGHAGAASGGAASGGATGRGVAADTGPTPTAPPPVRTASPSTASPATGTPLRATGTGSGARPVLLALGGCAAVAGAAGYGGLRRHRRRGAAKGVVLIGEVEETPPSGER
ncbi:DUF6801 domain-containing protein [Streptomyces doudnae]|uniref:DUF6801 domain-containing protein n=2 Tax=Streptomyces TaxID=1883 RepID=A0ABD5EFD9_9ACTN|nr:DUF6801 domain-containing protein [Streptomyces sp. DSM 41981]MDT0433397.1 hypothetical protein [Streptomyces sp. DSM 41981]